MVKQMQGYGWFPETFSNVWVDSYICAKKRQIVVKDSGNLLKKAHEDFEHGVWWQEYPC